MRVRVLFFGMLKDLAGRANDTVDLPDGASLHDLLAYYQRQIPRLSESLPSLALAVNQRYADTATKLKEGDEVALLPPVSGGSRDIEDEKSAAGELARARIVRDRIEAQPILEAIKRAEDGAVVTFEGIVRNQTRGRQTLFLDYEAYEEMALAQMESLAVQARERFSIRDVRIVHRVGRLDINEISVLIVVASAHRAAAFDACRWLIDTLKRTVPIWKKEYFADGAVWADGEPFPPEISRANSPGKGSPPTGTASN
jgi:MoaE-MoaD fusion protein